MHTTRFLLGFVGNNGIWGQHRAPGLGLVGNKGKYSMGVIWGLCSFIRFLYPLSSAEIASSQTKGG